MARLLQQYIRTQQYCNFTCIVSVVGAGAGILLLAVLWLIFRPYVLMHILFRKGRLPARRLLAKRDVPPGERLYLYAKGIQPNSDDGDCPICFKELGSTTTGSGCCDSCILPPAVQFTCQHSLCRRCMFALLESEKAGAKCPLCRAALLVPAAPTAAAGAAARAKPGGDGDGDRQAAQAQGQPQVQVQAQAQAAVQDAGQAGVDAAGHDEAAGRAVQFDGAGEELRQAMQGADSSGGDSVLGSRSSVQPVAGR